MNGREELAERYLNLAQQCDGLLKDAQELALVTPLSEQLNISIFNILLNAYRDVARGEYIVLTNTAVDSQLFHHEYGTFRGEPSDLEHQLNLVSQLVVNAEEYFLSLSARKVLY